MEEGTNRIDDCLDVAEIIRQNAEQQTLLKVVLTDRERALFKEQRASAIEIGDSSELKSQLRDAEREMEVL